MCAPLSRVQCCISKSNKQSDETSCRLFPQSVWRKQQEKPNRTQWRHLWLGGRSANFVYMRTICRRHRSLLRSTRGRMREIWSAPTISVTPWPICMNLAYDSRGTICHTDVCVCWSSTAVPRGTGTGTGTYSGVNVSTDVTKDINLWLRRCSLMRTKTVFFYIRAQNNNAAWSGKQVLFLQQNTVTFMSFTLEPISQ